MTSWKKYLLAGVIAVVAVFAYTRNLHRNVPSDLRDAPVSETGSVAGFLKEAADVKTPAVSAPVRDAQSASTDKAGNMHKTRCVTLDSNYGLSGGEFVVTAEKYTQKASVYISTGNPSLGMFQPPDNGKKIDLKDFLFTLCKKNNSSDFENSYEICGIRGSLNDRSYLVYSYFNLGAKIPSFKGQLSISDRTENLFDSTHIPDKLFQLEAGSRTVGHIVAYLGGAIDYNKTVKIQCESLSDNSIVVPGATR